MIQFRKDPEKLHSWKADFGGGTCRRCSTPTAHPPNPSCVPSPFGLLPGSAVIVQTFLLGKCSSGWIFTCCSWDLNMELEGLREGSRDRFNKQNTLKCKDSSKKIGALAIDCFNSRRDDFSKLRKVSSLCVPKYQIGTLRIMADWVKLFDN